MRTEDKPVASFEGDADSGEDPTHGGLSSAVQERAERAEGPRLATSAPSIHSGIPSLSSSTPSERTEATEPEPPEESSGVSEEKTVPRARLSSHPPGERVTYLPERYEDFGLLGRGGFGEVRQVRDRVLGRILAMKLLRPQLERRQRIRQRFIAEVKLAAALSHPGILTVHDFGELPDGRLWFTMPIVRGRTLGDVAKETFAAPKEARALLHRRLLDHFTRAAEAVAYAHAQGVIHRDLKPANIMVGRFGQVLVMDWGIARRTGDPIDQEEDPNFDPYDSSDFEELSPRLTQYGAVLGTPVYMAPEQATGEVERHGPATDVYSLGVVLYRLLSGRLPRQKPPLPLPPFVSPELRAITQRAMSASPEERHADAGELAAEMKAFLDGARRRERALQEIRAIAPLRPQAEALAGRAAELRHQASALLSAVPPHAPAESKEEGWLKEEEAESLEREAALLRTRWTQGIHGALAIDHELAEAHEALADHYKDALIEAERSHRQDEVARLEVLLAAHDRGKHAAILSGKGSLTLLTEPTHTQATLHRFVQKKRRLVLEPVRELGMTPILDLALERGSYVIELSAAGYQTLRYPVQIERGQRWDGVPPGESAPYPIPLAREGEIFEDEIYIPAGFAWLGGDPDAPDSLPRQRVWLDGFIIGRHPITNEEYLAFLNGLLKEGREAEAIAACPRANPGTAAGDNAPLAYDRDAEGRFVLRDLQSGPERGGPRTPVILIDWPGALAYARWISERRGCAYRLPYSLEREKATRGVDGRFFPWGNLFDPSFSCMFTSHAGEPGASSIDDYATDESPYGMRDGAGNSRDFCMDLWSREGPKIVNQRGILEPAPLDDPGYRAVRGGAWPSVESHCRAATRFALRPSHRRMTIGLRLARPFRPEE